MDLQTSSGEMEGFFMALEQVQLNSLSSFVSGITLTTKADPDFQLFIPTSDFITEYFVSQNDNPTHQNEREGFLDLTASGSLNFFHQNLTEHKTKLAWQNGFCMYRDRSNYSEMLCNFGYGDLERNITLKRNSELLQLEAENENSKFSFSRNSESFYGNVYHPISSEILVDINLMYRKEEKGSNQSQIERMNVSLRETSGEKK